MQLELVCGDITEQRVDAIVNAANSGLLGGGGVDGAIHRRGGPAIMAECRTLRAGRYPDGLPAGQAVATTAGQLPARWVIHTVGPVYAASVDRSDTLRSCYRESLRVAAELGRGQHRLPADLGRGVSVASRAGDRYRGRDHHRHRAGRPCAAGAVPAGNRSLGPPAADRRIG